MWFSESQERLAPLAMGEGRCWVHQLSKRLPTGEVPPRAVLREDYMEQVVVVLQVTMVLAPPLEETVLTGSSSWRCTRSGQN